MDNIREKEIEKIVLEETLRPLRKKELFLKSFY